MGHLACAGSVSARILAETAIFRIMTGFVKTAIITALQPDEGPRSRDAVGGLSPRGRGLARSFQQRQRLTRGGARECIGDPKSSRTRSVLTLGATGSVADEAVEQYRGVIFSRVGDDGVARWSLVAGAWGVAGASVALRSHRCRVAWTCAKSAAWGQTLVSAIKTLRTVMRIRAPILRSVRRIVVHCVRARAGAARPAARTRPTSHRAERDSRAASPRWCGRQTA